MVMLVRFAFLCLLLRLGSLLLLLLLFLRTLFVFLRVCLGTSLHLLRIWNKLYHFHHFLVNISVLLAAHLLDILLPILEGELMLHTLESGNGEYISKINDSSNLRSNVVRTLLLLSQRF